MAMAMRCGILALLTLVSMSEIRAIDHTEIEDIGKLLPLMEKDKYIRHIHSIINSYKNDLQEGRMVIETNALIDTKYKTWKRNADLINSLLALPKGMNDAGR